MISFKKLTIRLFILEMTCFPCSAQFNTVQTFSVQHQHKDGSLSTTKTLMKDTVKISIPEDLNNDTSVVPINPQVSLPLKEIKINSAFGKRLHPITKKYKLHNGIDLRARYEEVYSMLPGYIHKVGEDRISGKYIMIASGGFLISYCHLSKVEARKGDMIYAGEIIGISGNTGRSSGAHLHITCRFNGQLRDPAVLINSIKKIMDT